MDYLYKACQMLYDYNLKISVAESLTGGLIAADLVAFPGISKCLNEAYITYSNEAKHEILGVSESIIDKYGVVSKETARQMAHFVREKAGADIGLSSTGIAGPTGGSKDKPVGLVYLSCSIKDKVVTRKYIFKGQRAMVRYKSAKASIRLLYDCLNRYY